ncbi:MAG: hypothetical protein GXP16_11315 [Gammaproteobacteria bacterium]|nr:hypothetical protein [Gammaproteobacteria bacterium]
MFDPAYVAYVYCLFTAIVVVFQLALALGMPWGEMAMGGKFPGRYPLHMRIISLVMIVVLMLVAAIVLTRAGLMLEDYYEFSESAIWGVVVYSALGAIMNTITPSKKERMLWAPVSIVLFISVTYVAMN